MSSSGSAQAENLVSNAASLVEMLRDKSGEIDQLGALPDDVVESMADAGIWRMPIPERFGGLGPFSTRTYNDVLVELGKGNASAAWIAYVTAVTSRWIAAAWPTQVAEEVLDSGRVGPVAGGSGSPNYGKGLARHVDGGLMVSGRWGFASGIRNATWMFARAVISETETALVLMPKSDLEVADDWHVEGLKGSNSNSVYTTDEVFVPSERALDQNDFLRTAFPETGFVFFPPLVLGGAMTALELFSGKAKRSAPLTPYETTADMPGVQILVGRLQSEINLLSAFLQNSADTVDNALTGEIDLPMEEIGVLRHSAVHGCDLIVNTLENLQRAAGASTAAVTDALGRCCRDIRVMCLQIQMRELWASEQVGRAVLGVARWPMPAGL